MIIIPMICIGLILYDRSKHEITDQISNFVGSGIKFTLDNVEFALKSILDVSELIKTERVITSFAGIKEPIPYPEIARKYRQIRELLQVYTLRIKALSSSRGFDSFYLYFPMQKTFIDSKLTYYDNIPPENIVYIRKPKRDNIWFITTEASYFTLNNIPTILRHEKLLTYTTDIRDNNTIPSVSMAVNVQVDFLINQYSNIQKGIPGDFMLIDENGTFIACNNKELIGQKAENYAAVINTINGLNTQTGSFEIRMNKTNFFAVYEISEYTNWKYIVLIPSVEVFRQIYNIRIYFIFTIIIVSLLMLPICILISRTLYKPLEKLVFAMQRVETGYLEVRINDQRRDEYQKVYKGFNNMAEELKHLIEDLSNEKALNKQSEINLMQAQINPHFLYNTLDSIYSIAMVYKVDEIARIVSALSKFFRISLSGGKSDIPLKEALDIGRNYLTIQNIRFNNKIEYEISIPEKYMEIPVPKLLFQPIIENSVYHGMERKKGKGHLSITCTEANRILNIHIQDDGVGIPEDRLNALKESIYREKEGDSKNFALRNINKQLVLKYGPDFGLSIESEYGVGTRVTISIPRG
jgi:two-component system sensor histidine kinase YesM